MTCSNQLKVEKTLKIWLEEFKRCAVLVYDEVCQQQQISTGGHSRTLQEKEGVNDADLINEELPTKRALGVHWTCLDLT